MYHARDSRECAKISNDGAMRYCSAGTNLQARPRRYAFPLTQGLHFQALHPLSFLFTCNLHWCKHCTLLEVTTNVRKFSMTTLCVIAAQILICRPVLVGTLFATMHGLHFQALHPLSLLHFHMHLALVEALYRARGNHECAQISNDSAMRNYS